MLTNLKELLPQYLERDGAIGAFNLAFFSDIPTIIGAAEEMKAPVIIQLSPHVSEFIGYEHWAAVGRRMAEEASVPVVLHLDHASKLDDIWKALEAGYTSVMYDGSQLPFDENVQNTRLVVERAAGYGASVEAEIGSVSYLGRDTHKDQLSDPKSAADFAAATGCDALAVSVGTTHMMRSQTANLHFDLLQEIQEATPIPLVMHGTSGVPNDQLEKMRGYHVCKVNIGTALRMAFTDGVRSELAAHPNDVIGWDLLVKGMDQEKAIVKKKMELLGF
ncbi:MAG: class II fructose-bisphosphate aldolase [Lachnospiraceae bacterium]|nr:class II fructose-bisphosphate aldolase [Lachnospiraceae bacterium]